MLKSLTTKRKWFTLLIVTTTINGSTLLIAHTSQHICKSRYNDINSKTFLDDIGYSTHVLSIAAPEADGGSKILAKITLFWIVNCKANVFSEALLFNLLNLASLADFSFDLLNALDIRFFWRKRRTTWKKNILVIWYIYKYMVSIFHRFRRTLFKYCSSLVIVTEIILTKYTALTKLP